MKLLMIIVESSHKEELEALLSQHAVLGYTEIPQVYGSGTSGPRLGSAAFPKTSSIIFSVLEEGQVEHLVSDIKRYCAECVRNMKMIVWGVEDVI